MKYFLAAILFTVTSLLAQAQNLTVATGSSTGTYSRMLKEANAACATAIPVNEKNTSGSMENMALLTGNQVNAAFTSSGCSPRYSTTSLNSQAPKKPRQL